MTALEVTHLTTASLILGSMLASCSLQLVLNTHPKAAPSRTRVRITEPRINTCRAKVKLSVDICCLLSIQSSILPSM